MFEKNSANNVSACKYRLAQDAVHIIEPFMNDSRKVTDRAIILRIIGN